MGRSPQSALLLLLLLLAGCTTPGQRATSDSRSPTPPAADVVDSTPEPGAHEGTATSPPPVDDDGQNIALARPETDPAPLAPTPPDATTRSEPGAPAITDALSANRIAAELWRTIGMAVVGEQPQSSAASPVAHLLTPTDADESWIISIASGQETTAMAAVRINASGQPDSDSRVVVRLAPASANVTVRAVALTDGDGHPNALEVQLPVGAREELLLIIARPEGPLTLREESSAVGRSVLRDLDGDGIAELVRYSRLFDASGRRELVVDALVWSGRRFQPAGSVMLVGAVNRRLQVLEQELAAIADDLMRLAPDERPGPLAVAMSRLLALLTPMEGAPEPSSVIAGARIFVPPIAELPVALGEPAWRLTHELAIEQLAATHVYRFAFDVTANPLIENPVSVVGLDSVR